MARSKAAHLHQLRPEPRLLCQCLKGHIVRSIRYRVCSSLADERPRLAIVLQLAISPPALVRASESSSSLLLKDTVKDTLGTVQGVLGTVEDIVGDVKDKL